MGTIWNIIPIIALYVVFFIASAIISSILLGRIPDAVVALFILFAPVAFIIWYEKRRAAKITRGASRRSPRDHQRFKRNLMVLSTPHPRKHTGRNRIMPGLFVSAKPPARRSKLPR